MSSAQAWIAEFCCTSSLMFQPLNPACWSNALAPATFFETAFLMRYFHASTAREVADGFPIGDHTATHPRIGRLPKRRQLSEILGQADSIRPYGAPFPRMFRPPFGSFNGTTLSLLRRLHMLMVLWTVDSRDWAGASTAQIVQAAATLRAGGIILMHDAGFQTTVAAVPQILGGLSSRGLCPGRIVFTPVNISGAGQIFHAIAVAP